MDVGGFNAMSAQEAAAVVRPCADVAWWVDAVVDGRPYADLDAVLATADRASRGWSADDLAAALADHPRIGERPTGEGTSAGMSSREQAGVDPADTGVQQRLRAGNAAYEARFDRIFLVRAAGRTADEMLANLDQRLTHSDAQEVEATLGQLREIALLRLRGSLS